MAALIRTLTGSSQKSQSQENGGLSPPTASDLSRMTTTNTQTGVLNHLTEGQEEKLVQFKEKLQKDGWWSPDGVNGKPTHDDGTLLRYLRARKFDVQGAYGQFTDTEKWMKEQHVEELYEHFDVDFFERARSLYPQWTGHRDKRGIPIYVYEIKGLDNKAVDKYQKEATAYKAKQPNHKNLSTAAKLLPLFALYHNLLNFVLPFVSTLERPRPEVPVTNSTNIVDISGVSLRQFWNLKNHMQDASVLATAHYPETLDRIFIIGAPSFFPTVWGWIKRWFDPVTVSKIFILGRNEVTPILEKFMEPTSIPKKYGGRLDWRWGDTPDLDSETRTALERDGNRGWVKGPALWLNNERVVVGSVNGKPRRSDKEIAEKKPIVYAADYTEEPVHPDKRASVVSATYGRSTNVKNMGQLDGKTRTNSESPSTLVDKEPEAAMGAATATAPSGDRPATPKNQTVLAKVPHESVRTSPMGDSHVRLPAAQAASPAMTVEYISPIASAEAIPHQALDAPKQRGSIYGAVTTSAAAETAISASTAIGAASPRSIPQPTIEAAPHPAGHAQPGPLSNHAVEMNRKIAVQLQGESTVIIPADANGVLPHPDIVAASDATKGLAMETDKLALDNLGDRNHPSRPAPERFITALEF